MTVQPILHIDDPQLEAVRNSEQPVWAFDVENDRIAWANAEGLAMCRAADLGALSGMRIGRVLKRESRRQLEAYHSVVRSGGRIEEQLTIYPDGEPVTLMARCSGVRIEDGRVAVLVEGQVRTIEPGVLRAVEALNSTSIMFTLLDYDGRVVYENTSAMSTYGFTHPDAGEVNAFTARFTDPEAGNTAWEMLNSEQSFEAEMLVKTRSGQQRWHAVSADRTNDPATGRKVVLLEERDVTERRRMQQRMQLHERMATIGELAGGLAHEINNPLAYVLMNLDLIEELGPDGLKTYDPDELKTILSDLREGANRIKSTVFDLGELAKVDAGDHEAVDLHSALETAIAITNTRAKRRATVVRDFGAVPWVMGQRSRLAQVFVNILINAVQAIDGDDPTAHRITISTRERDGRIVVEIADTGHGVDEKDLAQIFEPFFSSKKEGIGTGLGLSVARQIVGDHDGEIDARQNEDGGLTVRVELLAADRPAEAAPHPISSEIRRILVVDDEPGIRRALTRLLDRHIVETAASGQEALELLEKRPFDIIFCDMMMPGMDGMDLYETVKQQGRGIERNFVFITAGAFEDRAARFLARVPNEMVQKPFNRDVLRKIVESA